MFAIMFCMMMAGAEWQTSDTGVFQPLRANEVVVRPDGAFYVKCFNDSQVRYFSKDGKLVKIIGGKGKGPGEFTYPTDLYFDNNRLYVFDVLTTKISAFDLDGNYVDAVKVPNRGLQIHKVDGGWVYGDWGGIARETEPAFFWVDESFKNKKTLAKLKDAGFSQGSMVWSDGSKTIATYAPIDNRPIIAVSPDKKRIYFSSIERFEVSVFDAATQEKITTLSRKEARIPFDEEWAEEKYKEARADDREKHNYKKNYPEYFPPMRRMIVAYDGTLVIDRWRGRPDDNHYPIGLAPDGKETKLKHKYATYLRLAGVHGDSAYIVIFNADDDEAGIAKCALKDADAFVEANPIEFEGGYGYSISISD